MSIGNLQFFIQMPWKSAVSKTKIMPRSSGSDGRNMRPMARSSSLTITSAWSTLPEGRVSGTTAGVAPARPARASAPAASERE